jgi:hypothetical protein
MGEKEKKVKEDKVIQAPRGHVSNNRNGGRLHQVKANIFLYNSS